MKRLLLCLLLSAQFALADDFNKLIPAQQATQVLAKHLQQLTETTSQIRSMTQTSFGLPFFEQALTDFEQSHLDILQRSMFHTNTQHLPIRQAEVEQLHRQMTAVQAALSELRGNLAREVVLQKKQERIRAKIELLGKQAEAIQNRYGETHRAAMRAELDALLKPLPDLRTQDSQIQELRANRYPTCARKTVKSRNCARICSNATAAGCC